MSHLGVSKQLKKWKGLSVAIGCPSWLHSPACLLSQGHFCKQIASWNAFRRRQLEKRGLSKLPIFRLLYHLLTQSSKRQIVLQNLWRKTSEEQMWNAGQTTRLDWCFVLLPAPAGDLTCCLYFLLPEGVLRTGEGSSVPMPSSPVETTWVCICRRKKQLFFQVVDFGVSVQ